MSDIHALSGAYAVDALDDIERAQFQRHLQDCDTCQQEVDSFRETAALFGDLSEVAPPPALRDKVLAGISTVRPLPPVVTETARPPRRRTRTFLAAAAAAVLIGAGAVTQLNDRPTQVEQVLAASDAETFTQSFPSGAKATVTRSKSLNRAVIKTSDMPTAPTGFEYVVWLQHDEVMVPAGVMPPGADNTLLLAGDPATAVGAGITVETAGEPHPEPEGTTVALFDFERA